MRLLEIVVELDPKVPDDSAALQTIMLGNFFTFRGERYTATKVVTVRGKGKVWGKRQAVANDA